MTILVADTFNRSNSTNNLGTTTTGSQTWTQHSGTWGIESDRAYQSNGVSSQQNLATVDGTVADGTVAATVISLSGAVGGGILVRMDATGANGYLAYVSVATSAPAYIFKITAGSYSAIATGSSTTVASGSVLSVELSGNSIVVKDDGVTIVSVTDSSFSTQTRHGLHVTAGTSVSSWLRFDDFSVDGVASTPSATGTAVLALTGSAVGSAVASGATAVLALTGSAVAVDGSGATATLALTGSATAVAVTASEVITVPIASGVDAAPRAILSPAPPPANVATQWPIERQAHLMAALSEANPRYRGGIDYEIERDEIGKLHVWVDGVDLTWLNYDPDRDVPSVVTDYTSNVPVNAASASLQFYLHPWDDPGEGALSMLDMDSDPAVEIALVRPDNTVDQLWEGFLAEDSEDIGTGETYTYRAEGLFLQAAHEPHDPPVFMESTDIGYLVADALNKVQGRRWNKIPRVVTGIPSPNRGETSQNVWQYVQDLLSMAWTEDGRQWTLVRVAPYTYRLQLKAALSTVHWTVTKGAPGVQVRLGQNQSQRRDALFCSGFARDGGYWENRFFPGLDSDVPPEYPMAGFANIDVGTTDADTTTGEGVTTWQRRMREIGYPVTVDGVMNSADTPWVTKIQQDRGLTVDGSLGPQTWAATWETNSTEVDLTSYRLPLVTKPEFAQYLYAANGAIVGGNPVYDPKPIRHAQPEVRFFPGYSKSEARPIAQKILDREGAAAHMGTIVLDTDPHETGSSRFDIKPGDNVKVIGHRGETVVQVSQVSVSDLQVTLTVDSRARDALTVLEVIENNREARRNPSSRLVRNDTSQLSKSQVVQYESESKAGFFPRTAVNGNSGLWTGRKMFVSQVGVAKVQFETDPNAELVVALFNRPTRTSVLASRIPDPLSSSDGWYDHVEELQEQFGLMEVFGTPENPGGYWPRQKGDGPLTGRLRDSASTLYDSPYGGFVWCFVFTSVSTWVEGRVFPAVPT